MSRPAPGTLEGAVRHISAEPSIRFDFAGDAKDGLTAGQQYSFRADFREELSTLRSWLGRQIDWPTPEIPQLQVFVSGSYKISRALVPAWEGNRGRMEFPAFRVATGKAAILHELSHVYLPNGNRFLAEGFATYLQALLGGNAAFPNFGRPLHGVARDCLIEIASHNSGAAVAVDLEELAATATPNPLSLAAARRCYAREGAFQTALYAFAGSFVEFLIGTRGLERFQRLYRLTPLDPGCVAAGTPDRWPRIYGRSLPEIAAEWKSMIIGAAT